MLLEIIPLKGVGPIRFGMTSEEVQSVMKEFCGVQYRHSKSKETDYFFGSALEVTYDECSRADFIGAQYYSGCGCDFEIYGIDPFDNDAKTLFEHIASKQTDDHDFDPDDYLFRDTIITLWGSEEQYDHKGGETRPVYAQVGIGNENYLEAIDQITSA
ncbi:hypothetical protein HHX48_16615 [Salinimonas sp. HHU 13199]|uniref:YubB ferredoxin-like domain-containing protein n=1 Tax=Salinimonas profundi TaxID=2729140 RepID=A0ABR8LQM2_9ALTE|nr:hypothetical protein [Salinimonas profundi]MBD3587361.1 hypothetical protein [Salinimonas profundi]